MRISSLLFVLYTLSFAATINAATINVFDGDQFDYDAANDYIFHGSLSAANPALTYGGNVEPGENMSFVVNAPPELDLFAILTTGPNGTGSFITSPSLDTVLAGTSIEFILQGDFFQGQTQWLTIFVGPEALAIIASDFGGSLDISGYVPPVPAIPIPAAAFMFAPALLGFMALRRKLSRGAKDHPSQHALTQS